MDKLTKASDSVSNTSSGMVRLSYGGCEERYTNQECKDNGSTHLEFLLVGEDHSHSTGSHRFSQSGKLHPLLGLPIGCGELPLLDPNALSGREEEDVDS